MVAEEELAPSAQEAWDPPPEVLRRRATRSSHGRSDSERLQLKAIAEYVGTSVAMIEKSYGRFISDHWPRAADQRAVRRHPTESGQPGTLREPFASERPIKARKPRVQFEAYKVVPGGIEPPFAT